MKKNQRPFELTVLSAKDLNKPNLVNKMDTYIVVYIDDAVSGRQSPDVKTPVSKDGGSNSYWNVKANFIIDEKAAQKNHSSIVYKVKCEHANGEMDLGEVHVPIKELLESPGASDGKKLFVTHQVMKPDGDGDGKPEGVINVAYQFGEKAKKKPRKKFLSSSTTTNTWGLLTGKLELEGTTTTTTSVSCFFTTRRWVTTTNTSSESSISTGYTTIPTPKYLFALAKNKYKLFIKNKSKS